VPVRPGQDSVLERLLRHGADVKRVTNSSKNRHLQDQAFRCWVGDRAPELVFTRRWGPHLT
jgi:hypothetical protein